MCPGPLSVAPEAPLPTPCTPIHRLDIYHLPSPRPPLPPPCQLSHAPHSPQPLPAHQPPLITCTLGSGPLYLHQGLHSPATNSIQDLRQTQSLWTSVSPCGTSGLQETWCEWLFLPKPSLEGASCPRSRREGPGEQKGHPSPPLLQPPCTQGSHSRLGCWELPCVSSRAQNATEGTPFPGPHSSLGQRYRHQERSV